MKTRRKYLEQKCPECGYPLEIYYEKEILDFPSGNILEIELIRHCKYCLSDWQNTYSVAEKTEDKLYRKFWG